jgi:hypothetical protein
MNCYPKIQGDLMKNFKANIALGLVNLIVVNSIAGSVAFATSTSTVNNSALLLLNDVKTLQAGIDSGTVKSQDAINTFASSLTSQNISIDDVNSFVQTQMTDEQFQTFQNSVNSSLRGIDESTLTPQETGEIVGQALTGVHTEGLYWSGCANVWTGAALITAAVVTGIFAIIKSKSTSSIQSDYQNKIANSNSNFNTQISNDQNWQTAYPQIIQTDKNDVAQANTYINQDENELVNARVNYANANTTQQENEYQSQITSLEDNISVNQNDINADQNDISNAQNQIAIYTANPAQVQIDVTSLGAQRDQAQTDLSTQETAAVAAAPANQALGVKLGIGAGIGAAVGAGLLIYGIKEGACD